MFLHIGSGRCVPVKDIAMIVDCEAFGGEERPLNGKQYVDAGGRRSAVVTADTVYYTPIATGALRKRLQALIKVT